ncbi:phosphoglycerate mutase, putative [Entamoeba invadens IP1]|uniref:phosphoglycerate mutase, putative n=1 Tax=Entamoeba invadens IP1 TaxID=370355 RepID=UPI0002C3EF48|nr:phosphoglycerate mutase, putative [Entamoeba invadens IP1]ELP85121.1 phosphoglycerate mutase, putative [Entamoeba invadens IP1]|eukprot:XP_004184467.1 phosphoglycerate mutase, putative [Entamoeba invadens IP1]
MKTIYIVRHGETPINKEKLIHGRTFKPDCTLSEKGFTQAEEFYEAHKDLNIQHIFTSSLLRSQLSVNKFLEKYPHTALKEFDEVDFGEAEGKTIFENGVCRLDPAFNEWAKGNYDAKMPRGQSMNEVIEEQKRGMEIVTNTPSDVLIASHRRAIVIFLSWTLQIPYNKAMSIEVRNLQMFRIGFEKSTNTFVDIDNIATQCNTTNKNFNNIFN